MQDLVKNKLNMKIYVKEVKNTYYLIDCNDNNNTVYKLDDN